eukprot:Skav213889  [mRNA]  locus=scaffold245:101765:108896:- [translate_table: standard]
MATTPASTETSLSGLHQYKLPPPSFDGDYATYEEWKFKFTAYLGLKHHQFPHLLARVETTTEPITDTLLTSTASTTEEGATWVRLASELQFILVSITKGASATVVRQQGINANGFETWRQLNRRFSIPVGTRSIGYLTKLLKPIFDEHRFEETFSAWEFEVHRYERDNGTTLPDGIKIAVLINETKGALQQHLQLTASTVTQYAQLRTIILEYYRAQASFGRMQQQQAAAAAATSQGPAPMDIGAFNKGFNKGKGKSKGKGKHQGKGYGSYNNYSNKGKGKYQRPIGQATSYKGASKGFNKGYNKGKGPSKGFGKGKGKPSKGKAKGIDTCYKCGQPGHIVRDCRVVIYSYADEHQQPINDPTYDWYNDQYQDDWHQDYDQDWYGYQGYDEEHHYEQHQPQQLALPPPPPQQTSESSISTMQAFHIAAVHSINKLEGVEHLVDNRELHISNGRAPASLNADRYRGHRDHRLYFLRLNQENINVMASQPLAEGSNIQVCVPVHHRSESIQDVDMEDHPDDPSTLDSSLPVPAASPGTPPGPPPASPSS